MDRHQYLHYFSSDPEHTKVSILFRCGLRVSRTYILDILLEKTYLLFMNEILQRHLHLDL